MIIFNRLKTELWRKNKLVKLNYVLKKPNSVFLISQSPVQTLEDELEVQAKPAEPSEPIQEFKQETQKKEEEELRKETDSPRRSITPNAANGKYQCLINLRCCYDGDVDVMMLL